ncbi:MAG: M1 family aminopeptidase, partial [Chloroflexota bacterium]|nr:M1 family aminopeptidase [Chloroflexota bacterium]
VTAPGDLVVVTTGIEVGREGTADAVSTQFVSGPVRDFFLIMSPDFEVETSTINGGEIRSYHLPGHASANSDALYIARDSLDIYNQQFGHYPYRELDVVEAPLRGISGVEFPGIILVRSGYYNNTDDPVFTVVLAHEVAHQWWYNVVGNDVFDDPWLDEALTTYTSSLYYEFEQGKPATKGITDYWQANYKGAVDRGHDERITQNLAYFENLSDSSVYGRIVYSKGALFFKALREEIGDEAFFHALKDYYASYRYQIAKPEHLLTLFEETAGRPLTNFYQDWLYTPSK